MWESCLSGSVRGRRANEGMEKILWHRRESRRKTEKTNIFLQPREAPAYSKSSGVLTENPRVGSVDSAIWMALARWKEDYNLTIKTWP
jgi:hypothetical protein